MGKIAKIFQVLSFACLGLLLTFVGVWAMTNLDFSVGGDITYTAPPSSQGYEVTINNAKGTISPCRVKLYINESTNDELYSLGSSANWETLSYTDVKNVKIEVVDNMENLKITLTDHAGKQYTTRTETLSIDIKENTTLTFSLSYN